MPDIASLSALAHASPTYHASYLENRDAVFTIVTLRSLQSQGVNILSACVAATVFLREGELASEAELKVAFQCLYSQIKKPDPPKLLTYPIYRKWRDRSTQPTYTSTGRYEPPSPITGHESIKLSIEQCLVLLKVQHMIPLWRIDGFPRRLWYCWTLDIKGNPSQRGERCDVVFEPLWTESVSEALGSMKPDVVVVLSSSE